MECTLHRLVADVAPLAGDRVALVRYRDTSSYDGQGGWFLPDDLLEHGEHPDEAARRILREQLGWDGVEARLSHIESFGEKRWHIVFHYAAELPEALSIQPGANVHDAAWFGSDELPPAGEVAHGGWGSTSSPRSSSGGTKNARRSGDRASPRAARRPARRPRTAARRARAAGGRVETPESR